MTHELSHENSGDGNSVDRGQILLAVLIGLALIASVIMLLADSDGAMKIALLAALWASIIGFFLVYRYRKQVEATTREMEAQAQSHQAQLQQQETERHAEQLQLEVEYQEKLREEEHETLTQIQAQLDEMRAQLSELSGREWGYEPTMLHAEARRILELESQQLRAEQPAPEPVAPEHVETVTLPEKLEAPQEVVDVTPTEPEPEPEEPARRSRHAAPDENGGRRRRDERKGGVSVSDLLAAARKREQR